jgi:MOSC domain-containing protein YiiM
MFKGQLVSIYITSKAGAPLTAASRVRAIPGKGLEGDRYYNPEGTYSDRPEAGREVTLIEIEALQALEQEKGITLEPGQARRNLVTQGVPLNHLVGKEFQVGEVTLRGIRLCEPCDHLAGLTQPEVKPGLVHRGGLRAQVLNEGVLKAGDEIFI